MAKEKPIYKVGDKLMGYAEGIGMDLLVAGTVAEVQESTTIGYSHEYNILLDPRIVVKEEAEEGKTKKIDKWWLAENEAVPFNEERFMKAREYENQRKEYMIKARGAYISMHKELYPEKYNKKEEEEEVK